MASFHESDVSNPPRVETAAAPDDRPRIVTRIATCPIVDTESITTDRTKGGAGEGHVSFVVTNRQHTSFHSLFDGLEEEYNAQIRTQESFNGGTHFVIRVTLLGRGD